jgi:hypothetical protein
MTSKNFLKNVDNKDENKVNHINRALPTVGHTEMYNMHKYFARKQEDVINEYIKCYT